MDEAHEDPRRPMSRPTDDFVPLLESNDPVMRRRWEKAKRAAFSDATILLRRTTSWFRKLRRDLSARISTTDLA
jgi:hypothetical protein